MSDLINLSKILSPKRRKDFLRRARLLDLIHQNIERKLIFISAPAGYGKTSVMVDFASDVDAAVCWFQVTPGDEDLGQFAQYLIAAFRQKFKNFGEALEGLFHGSGGMLNSQNLAIAILNEIIAKVDDFCFLILDDYHLVGESVPVVNLVEMLLDHLPDQVRLVIASRSEYGIPTMKLYVRNDIFLLGKDQLRFDVGEITTLIRQNFHYTIPLNQAEQLAKRSDGWIVAILLSMNVENRGKTWKLENPLPEQMYRFLAEDVIQREKPELREFMLATSILEEFSEPLASYLLEIPTAQILIQELDKRNLFITSIETLEGITYRYHQLFLEFLQDQLAKGDPERKQRFHRRAAEWFHGKGIWGEAILQKLAAGDRLEAAAWMDDVASHLYVSGQMNLLNQWAKILSAPSDIRATAPQLLLNQAKVLINQGHFKTGEELLDLIEPVFRDNGNVDQLVSTLLTRAISFRNQFMFKQALDLAETAQKVLLSHE
jgi:LuxR family transcriptional regulator, maltose regulon positive regulatory protein